MKITDVRVYPVDEEKLRAFATVTFENMLVVRDIRVLEGPEGMFLSMPARRGKDGTWRDVVHPIDDALRDELTRHVLAAYEREQGT